MVDDVPQRQLEDLHDNVCNSIIHVKEKLRLIRAY